MEETTPPSNLSMDETTPPPTAPLISPPPNQSMEEITLPPPIAPPILPLPPPLIASGIVMGPTLLIPQPVGPTANVVQLKPRVPAPWSTGLFDCFNDVDNCCMTCFCPCITLGQIAEIVDGGSVSCCTTGALYAGIMCLTGCHCLYSCFYRSKMRGQFFLEESPCADCCVHCCCEPCALCQEYRELRHRGLDPYFGWHGNLGRQMAMIPPSVDGGMTR